MYEAVFSAPVALYGVTNRGGAGGFVKKVGPTPDGSVLYGDFRPKSNFFNKAGAGE